MISESECSLVFGLIFLLLKRTDSLIVVHLRID